MPSPEQTRRNRIQKLKEWAEKEETIPNTVDRILRKAEEMFPSVSRNTARSYSIAVLRILKWKRTSKVAEAIQPLEVEGQ